MIEELLEKFGMLHARGNNVTSPPGMLLDSPCAIRDREEGEYAHMKFLSYKELVGALFHITNTTRPDIAFAASFLSRFMQDPREMHWRPARHVLRYLMSTKEIGVLYRRQTHSKLNLHGYTDSDFATDVIERKYVGGYVFSSSGGAIS